MTAASACCAPSSALYLRPDGVVAACCATGYAVGTVTGPERSPLADLWRGAAIRAQQAALDGGRFDLGCQGCQAEIASVGRDRSFAATFDRFAPDPAAPGAGPRLIDFALSNACNLQCAMCHGGLSSAIRAHREGLPPLPSAYDDRFFTELEPLLADVEHCSFKGGEPFLARENDRVWELLVAGGRRPSVSITTNGTVVDDRVLGWIDALGADVIVSVDAMDPEVLAATRVGVDPAALWRNVDRLQAATDAAGRTLTLSCCSMATTWAELPALLAEADRRGAFATVVPVHQPRRFDLLARPPAEVAAALAHLEAARPPLRRPELAAEYDRVLARLRSHLQDEAVVAIRAPQGAVAPPTPTNPPLTRDELARLRADLTASYGDEPLVLEVRAGRIVAVDDPAWAAWLAPRDWTDAMLDEVPDLARDRQGLELVPGVALAPRAGVEHVVLAVGGRSPRPRRLHAYVATTDAAGGRTALLYADGPGPT